ncbi:hypothetical protein [Amycolatopsis panacis]|uniref:Uncharacterized protein n=1 Tax=Amycolatopsis panacis TaxID=2340917 RepID=A0A419I2E2_9PSEU|nr:hypothetical protein [Amycolatopsis panacis]RJQ84068.1 hypothetical protein D5S19_18115 [Amycolatopsis panacis]
MIYPLHPDDWMTPEMTRAENDLIEASWEAQREVERTDDLIDDINSQLADVTGEDIENFKKAVLTPPSPPEWNSVRTHIDNGEFSWRDLIEGKVSTHPDVIAAYEATAATRFVIGANHGLESPSPKEAAELKEQPVTDDDYFEEQNFFDT